MASGHVKPHRKAGHMTASDQCFYENNSCRLGAIHTGRLGAIHTSIGSNQLSKRSTVASAAGCEESGFVVMLVMAWSPVRRTNAG